MDLAGPGVLIAAVAPDAIELRKRLGIERATNAEIPGRLELAEAPH
jgi:hypothetical protein